ncbi:MAG TPA: hypothetical protein VMZ53_12725 [Kofleriaceae bacterium]|nr:hypothetical protein [Kofleriaceae bacterium]
MRAAGVMLLLIACKPHHAMPPPAGPDQSVHDAMVLVCDAPVRAEGEKAATRADAIAGHLTDGVGNAKVLDIVEAWKTDGVNRTQLTKLVSEAKLSSCALRDELR